MPRQWVLYWLIVWAGSLGVSCVGLRVATPVSAPVVELSGDYPLPMVVAEAPLAATGQMLLDLQLDPAAQRLYITDSGGQLHILDVATYAEVATLPIMGNLQLDAPSQRLYVMPVSWSVAEQATPVITVIDTATNTIIGTLPGQVVALDVAQQRLFVGDYAPQPTPAGIRVYDAATLTLRGQLEQAGVPFYNPIRAELLVMNQTLYQVDPTTGAVMRDLFPEVAQQPLAWCNGCRWVDEVHILPEANLIAAYLRTHCTGGGCQFQGPPTFLDAATLQPVTDITKTPELQGECGSERSLLWPIQGRHYRTYSFFRYVGFHNLILYDAQGAILTWRDGIWPRWVNAQTGQAYLANGDILDLATLTPRGRWPEGCIFTVDVAQGRLYARGRQEEGEAGLLRVIAQAGGALATPPAAEEAALAGHSVTAILLSPAYAQDQTLLVVGDGMTLFRSTDRGATWLRLRGGLPEGAPLTLHVAFSPNYVVDQTLFVAGLRNEGRGEGVWRSTNGGLHWEPLWQGLEHLRLTELHLSPAFAADQTLLVKGVYYQVASGQSGESWQRSTDGGLHWSVVATSTYSAPLPAARTFVPSLAATPPSLTMRLAITNHQIEVSPDHGVSWRPAPLPLAADEWVQTIIPAPTESGTADQQMIYVLSDYHLWRTPDGGHQWEVWVDPLAIPRTYTNALRTLAISPLLADGAYHLFLGTTDGQFLLPNPTADWLPIHHAQ